MIIPKDKEKFLADIFKNGLKSQSFLIAGDNEAREEFTELLFKFLSCEDKTLCQKCAGCKFKTLDTYRYETPQLKIDEAREIQEKSSQSSWSGRKVFVIKTYAINSDTQATLLKTLEEPHENTYFIISMKAADGLSLPLLSRLTLFRLPVLKTAELEEIIEKFSKLGLKKELEEAARVSKERQELEEVFSALEFWTEDRLRLASADKLKKLAGFIEELFQIKKRFFQKTYFNRMLLEHLLISKVYLK